MTLYLVINSANGIVIAVGNTKEITDKYISQFNIKSQVNIVTKNVSDDRYDEDGLLNIQYLSNDVVLTTIEMQYYNDTLKKMYDDMKTSITALILYSNIGDMSINDAFNLKGTSKFLYEKMKSYEDFIDSLNRNILFSNIIHNPLTMYNILKDYHTMQTRYKQLITGDM